MSMNLDDIWETFCASLPPELRPMATDLPHRLSLVPVPGIPWSRVFKNEFTLAAPSFLAAAMPDVPSKTVTHAATAHMLAIIDAFATDRLLDRQILGSIELMRLLDSMRTYRDRAIAQITGGNGSVYRDAETASTSAIHTERVLLEQAFPLSFFDYAYLSRDKQAPALPAPLALARAAGWNERRVLAVRRVVEGILLGLQFFDDAVDWEEDWMAGRAWAVSLSRSEHGRVQAAGPRESIRQQVHESGVVAKMVDMARRTYRDARRLASALGAVHLANWVRSQEAIMADAAHNEAKSAGYVVRAHQLSNWVTEVLG
jgi:hypothetical protein